ncbi:hypothetical protein [Candidatus Accumulibacter sp. ACC003]|uniref:hypothetical protein n=1 Tax=Candidatus Accumulibacter sp. ACC003 TaxID=2823334 RepID=UPI0025C2E076|nr:hypothetical protein [Candidatus Accumulibacter sp. ACC003]
MHARRLLYLNGHQLSAYHWQAGVLIAEGSFDAGNVGSLPFAGYLAQHSKSIFSILANVSEEGFHIETIPFLRGGDRRAIIARKLGQLFFNVSLSASLSLGHQKSRRKDERILLAAFTNHELFAPWLAAMANAEVALAGIYSLPLLGPLLLKKLGVARDPCLLLSIQDQSIRQSYLENGELHFSRLTPLTNSSIGGIAQTFASEAAKLQQYLVSQRLIGRQQPLVAYLLAHANTRKAIESSCIDRDTLVFAILDIEESARLCGLKALPENTHCEPLFLNLLATDPPRSQFADDELRHNYHLWLLRGRGVWEILPYSILKVPAGFPVRVFVYGCNVLGAGHLGVGKREMLLISVLVSRGTSFLSVLSVPAGDLTAAQAGRSEVRKQKRRGAGLAIGAMEP